MTVSTETRIAVLLAKHASALAQATLETQRHGEWSCDYAAWMQELEAEMDALLTGAESTKGEAVMIDPDTHEIDSLRAENARLSSELAEARREVAERVEEANRLDTARDQDMATTANYKVWNNQLRDEVASWRAWCSKTLGTGRWDSDDEGRSLLDAKLSAAGRDTLWCDLPPELAVTAMRAEIDRVSAALDAERALRERAEDERDAYRAKSQRLDTMLVDADEATKRAERARDEARTARLSLLTSELDALRARAERAEVEVERLTEIRNLASKAAPELHREMDSLRFRLRTLEQAAGRVVEARYARVTIDWPHIDKLIDALRAALKGGG